MPSMCVTSRIVCVPLSLRKTWQHSSNRTPTKVYFAERALIGIFRRPDRVSVVWRQFLTKAEGEFVKHTVFIEKDSCILIDHCLICW